MRGIRSSALAAKDAAHHAAQNLPAQLAADSTNDLLAHRLDHALTARCAEHGIAHGATPIRSRRCGARRCRRATIFAGSGACTHRAVRRRFFIRASCQHLFRRIAVDGRVVFAADWRALSNCDALRVADRANAAAWRAHHDLLDRRRYAAIGQGGGQRFADRKLSDRGNDVEFGIGDEGLRGRLDCFLVTRSEGAQRVLDTVTELAKNHARHIIGILRTEIDAHALGADQSHHLFHALQKRWRRIVKQQVRLIEEKHHLRLVQVADFRQLLEQFGQ